MSITHRRHRLAAVAVGAVASLALPMAAQADTTIPFAYDASGTSTIAKTGSTVNLGPTTLNIDLNATTGTIGGSMTLPGTTTKFKVAGFIPVTADVDFIVAAPLSGTVSLSGMQATVNSTAEYYVKLSNIKVVGFPTFAGSHCKTEEPVSIPANTPAGEAFDLLNGGRLVGEYTIGDFENCGLNTWLINELVPGSGNTVDIQASNGRVVS